MSSNEQNTLPQTDEDNPGSVSVETQVVDEISTSLQTEDGDNSHGNSVASAEESVDVESAPDAGTVTPVNQILPITMTGAAFAKLQKIMEEKNLDLEKAMEYFFNLHQKESTPPKPKGRPGRPRKGTAPKDKLVSYTSAPKEKKPSVSTKTSDGDGDDNVKEGDANETEKEFGSNMADGRRRSRRTIRRPKTDQYAYFDNLKEEEIDSDIDIEELEAVVQEVLEEEDEEQDPTVSLKDVDLPKKSRAKRRKIDKDEFLTPEEQENLKCIECDRTFEGKSQLVRHKWNFHDVKPRPFVCEICGYGALYNCDYVRHMRIHSRETVHKCDVCDFTTIWKKNLDIHMQLHDPDREPWKCEICGEVVYSQQKIKQHKLSHDKTAIKCDLCDAVFENQRFLDMHRITHSKDKPYKCEHCKFETGFKANLRNHLYNRHRIGEKYTPKKKEFKCEKCSKMFKNEERRLVHSQIHDLPPDVPKPPDFTFYCPYGCDYRSKDIDHVVKHMVIHSDQKTFRCDQCDYATKWKKDLANHMLRHTGEKNERCEICGYTCYTKCRLKVHMNKHTNIKEHMCEWCGQYFKHKSLLKIHTLYHTEEPKYKCDQCDFATITDTRLKKHKLSHCEDRLYVCDICDKMFKQAHHLNQHRDAVHLGKPGYRHRPKAITYTTELGEQRIILQAAPDGTGETVLSAEELGDALTDQQVVVSTEEANPSENCQYVMVHTPSGYQYVALVLPPKDDGSEEIKQNVISETVIEEPAQALHQLSQGGATMEEAQILLPQIEDDQQYVYVTLPEGTDGEAVENIAAVETLIALQP